MRAFGASCMLVVACTLAACIRTVPPALAPERPLATVSASFDATWNAVIDVFVTNNIPIRNLEKASGLIVAEFSPVPPANADRYASCGGIKHGLDPARALHATHAEYNVVVRAVSSGSTVLVNVRWTSRNPTDRMRPDLAVCSTTNVWEAMLESEIRARAERSGT